MVVRPTISLFGIWYFWDQIPPLVETLFRVVLPTMLVRLADSTDMIENGQCQKQG